MTIHIEISKSYKPDLWRIRIGDLEGAIECSNITKEEILNEIKEEMEKQ
jgi:hypothetical protein